MDNLISVKAKMAENMLLMGKICLPNMFSVPSPEFHKDLARVYHDKSIDRCNIIAPRGHAKSSIMACVAVLHHIFFEPGPKFIVLVSKTAGHADRLLQTIKDALEYSPTLRYIFGYYGQHSARVWRTSEVVLKDGTYILTRGTGQMVRGLKYGDQRPTYIILDDPEDEENTVTPERIEKNLRWMLTELLPARDAKRGRLFIIGTPQTERSMVMSLLNMQDWKNLRYQALSDEVMLDKDLQEKILNDEVKSQPHWSLWPEMWDAKKLLIEKRSMESIGKLSYFYREYQCQVIGDDEQLFRPSDICTYDGELRTNGAGETFLVISSINGEKLDEPDDRPVSVYMGVDPASSLAQAADFSAIVATAIDALGNRFVLPYFHKKVEPLDLAEAIYDKFVEYNPVTTRIESTGYQEMLRGYMRELADRRGIHIPGLEIKELPRERKSRRIESMQPFFRKKQVFILDSMRDLRNELLSYRPNSRSGHDDLLDALFYSFKNANIPTHEGDLSDLPKAEGLKRDDFEGITEQDSWLLS